MNLVRIWKILKIFYKTYKAINPQSKRVLHPSKNQVATMLILKDNKLRVNRIVQETINTTNISQMLIGTKLKTRSMLKL